MSNDTAHKLRRMAVMKESLKKGVLSLSGALAGQVKQIEQEELKRTRLSNASGVNEENSPINGDSSGDDLTPSEEVMELLRGILGEAFRGYDQDGNGTLSKKEFSLFLTDFHESISTENVDSVFSQFDRDGSNTIDYHEFICACYIIITQEHSHNQGIDRQDSDDISHSVAAPVADSIFHSEGEGEEEEEEVPEDLTSLTPEQQQSAIKRRAFFMLFIGTALVLAFSDPMVDVLSEVAVRLDIPAFYVSFILAPLASNASEVIASQYYAAKKTRKTITVSLTALEGAASMNNTFCLAIFMALIFFRGLAWQYSAETISIILVQFGMGMWALRGKMSTLTGFIVMTLFPLSVMFVALLEYLGMD